MKEMDLYARTQWMIYRSPGWVEERPASQVFDNDMCDIAEEDFDKIWYGSE